MSNPLSNLKKPRKAPLPPMPNSTKNNVPFRQRTIDVDSLLDDVSSEMASTNLKKVRRSHKTPENAPKDGDLLASMMSRLSLIETQLLKATQLNIEKDKRIKILEEKCQILNKARENDVERSKSNFELEKKCLQLQIQVQDMEAFLEDYGMVWVGNNDDGEVSDEEINRDQTLSHTNPTWNQEASLGSSTNKFSMDYDLVIKNVNELNVLAGEGVAKVQHTTGGARLKMPEPVPLTLYANGIVMFSGPFRSFKDELTKHCMQDLMDGYFPSELQKKYPDGIPFVLTDKRSTYFKDKWDTEAFTGTGQALGGETVPSRLIPTNLTTQYIDVTTNLPGQKMSTEQFLKRIPQNVIKNGKVINVRETLNDHTQGQTPNSIVVVETSVVRDIVERHEQKAGQHHGSQDVTTLRIKSEGDKTFIVKMKYNETIGNLRDYLDKLRPGKSSGYDLVTTFPKKSYQDNSMTLQTAGLVPNATLHLKPKS